MEPRLRWLANGAVAAAALAALALAASGLGVRAGLWSSRAGFGALRWAALLALLGAALAAVALVMARPSGAGAALVAAGLVVSAAVLAVPWRIMQQARRVPAIHDVTTDTADPPAFVAVLPLRAGAPNAAAYGGPEVAAKQASAYPEIKPLHLAAEPAAAFAAALAAARGMGWEIVAADPAAGPAAGRIEATATTRWFAFKDDVVVRLRPEGGGTRVDVRSVSRVGRSDLGTNARRIREYLARLGG
jgi:uncharacterized protein (DUF1499 family)